MDQPQPPVALTIKQACTISNVGRSKLYIALQQGSLRAKKLGKKTLIRPQGLLGVAVDARLPVGIRSGRPWPKPS
jgi:excisionase family DNA binding protein